jgi:anti-sigma factor RsiW
MSHLGDLLSALVDGELCGAELDRANAHLAACGHCRGEAVALRRLKHDLRALAVDISDAGPFTDRLLAMAGTAEPAGPDGRVPARRAGRERAGRERGGRRTIRARAASRRGGADPYTAPPSPRPVRRRRVRYMLWSTLSLVVVGVGGAAFGMGGGGTPPGPRITPQLEVFDLQHAITSGDIPFPDPAVVPSRVPVGAATP